MKIQIRKHLTVLVSIAVLSIVVHGCSGGQEIQSSASNNEIKIDGNAQDWGTIMKYVKDDNIAFGFMNDNENLYVGIVTSDRSKIMRILSTGLTIWFDAGNDKLGIRFPLKPEPDEMQFRGMQQDNNENPDRDKRIENAISKRTYLQIINEDGLPLFTDRSDKGPDFIAKMGFDNDRFVYELKVPLTNNEFAERMFDQKADNVEINFVTGKFEGGNFPGGGSGNFGGMRPRNGNMGGRRGNHPPRERTDFDPLDYTFNVKLVE